MLNLSERAAGVMNQTDKFEFTSAVILSVSEESN